MRHQPGEQAAAVGAADRGLDVIFRMRHQAEHVQLLVQHAGNRIGRTVHVPLRIALAFGVGIAEQHASFRLEPADRALAGEVVALAMRDRHADHLARIVAARERRVGSLDLQVHVAADELHAGIAQQHAGQQLGLAQDLEAVAHAHHEPALARVIAHRAHDRRARRDRAAAQVVAVGEAAGQHHEVGAGRQLALGMPYHGGLAPRDQLERVRHVALTVRSGENDDSSFHKTDPLRCTSMAATASPYGDPGNSETGGCPPYSPVLAAAHCSTGRLPRKSMAARSVSDEIG